MKSNEYIDGCQYEKNPDLFLVYCFSRKTND